MRFLILVFLIPNYSIILNYCNYNVLMLTWNWLTIQGFVWRTTTAIFTKRQKQRKNVLYYKISVCARVHKYYISLVHLPRFVRFRSIFRSNSFCKSKTSHKFSAIRPAATLRLSTSTNC